MPKGYPKNGINLGWIKKGTKPANYESSRPFEKEIECEICHIKFTYSRRKNPANPWPRTCSKECHYKLKSLVLRGKPKSKTIKWPAKVKKMAQRTVQLMVKRGLLERGPCAMCGNLQTEAHHYLGYDRVNWLKVKWLCSRCHHEEHTRLRNSGEYDLL